VDYFSIGTNDLVQYTLAADRNNPKVRKYFDPYHPAVLQSIKYVVDVANRAGKPISICGEMAADPMNALLLMGMGISEFSLSAPSIPVVKQAIRRSTFTLAKEIAERALAMETGREIKGYLEKKGRELGI
jgi:phosphotransferase system enzyme I (PtsP)